MSPKLLNILLLVASFVLYYYVINPLYFGAASNFFDVEKSIPRLTERVNTFDKTIAAVKTVKAHSEESFAKYSTLTEEDKKKILTMVPVEVNDIKLMSELVKISELTKSEGDQGVAMDGMGIKDKGGLYSVSFNINTTYANFKKMMKIWESSGRLFSMQSVTFNPGKTEEDLIKFNIELYTYYMK